MLLFDSSPRFRTNELDDPLMRGVAELGRVVLKRDEPVVTEKDLQSLKGMVATHQALVAAGKADKSPLKALNANEQKVFIDGLTKLDQYVHTPDAHGHARILGKNAKKAALPYCTSFQISAVADKKVQSCAQAIVGCFDAKDKELNLGRLLSVKDAMADLNAGVAPRNPDLALKVGALLQSGAIDAASFSAIDNFMLSGIGGIMSHGPVRIGDKTFEDVFALPMELPDVDVDAEQDAASDAGKADDADATDDASDDEAPKAKPSGKGKPADKAEKKEAKGGDVDALIKSYEARFSDVGYDRIYIKGGDGKLYVALNEHGAIDGKVHQMDPVSMKTDNHLADSGRVLKVVDIDNSVFEATLGFFGKIGKRILSSVKALFEGKVDSEIKAAAKKIVDNKAPAADDKQKLDLKTVLSGGALLTGVGAAAVNVPVALGIVAGTAGVVSGMNLINYLTQKPNMSQVLRAAGVTVTRDQPRGL